MTLTHQVGELEKLAAAYEGGTASGTHWQISRGRAFRVTVFGQPVEDHPLVTTMTSDNGDTFGTVTGTGDTFAEAVADANNRLLIVLAHLDAAAA